MKWMNKVPSVTPSVAFRLLRDSDEGGDAASEDDTINDSVE